MSAGSNKPVTRAQANRMLVVNAVSKPWPNIALPSVLAVGTIIAGLPVVLMLVIAVLAWLALSAVTYFDEEEADKVIGAERARRRAAVEAGTERVDLGALGAPIAQRLSAVRAQEGRIRDAIDRAELPFTEVSDEVDGFVRAAERAATRAQLLYEYLEDQPVDGVQARLTELCAPVGEPTGPGGRRRAADPSRQELVDALSAQLEALDRAHGKLDAFYVEMERIAVELGNVRGQLLSVSATTEAAAQRDLAAGVRALREQVTTVADGMSEALSETDQLATSA